MAINIDRFWEKKILTLVERGVESRYVTYPISDFSGFGTLRKKHNRYKHS